MKTIYPTQPLREVIVLEYGKPLPESERSPQGDYAAYGANGILCRSNKAFRLKPSIIVGRKGSAGEVTLTDGPFWPTDVTYFVDYNEEKYSLKYLYYLLKTLNLPRLAKGVKPGINRNEVYDLIVPVPPLDEQKRIVAILDQAFASIAIAKANTEKNLANARDVFERYLDTAFSGDHTKWLPRKLGDQSMLQIIDGDRGANYPKKTDFTNEGHCVFLSTKNVRPDGFRFDDIAFIDESKDQSLRNGKLRRRDVILTTRGTIGNIALYGDDVEYSNIRINSGMLIFRPNEDIILSDFLFEIFRSKIMKSQINEFVTGAAQPQLPIKTLINFTIPVPISVDDQTAIVSRLRELNHETRQLEQLSRSKLTALDDLKQSLLHAAFTGQLTASEPVAA